MVRFPAAAADPCRTAVAGIPAGGQTVERSVALPTTTLTTAIILELT
ncbi:hypothetical protein GJV26_19085 [Massilia dura]|uniref:Uncharacterized protein n=1 Tax=Pseudoduganella dura TaxID=321982 RepID=A0A6I3XG82_9BURK|nr:hypothetical protein [Pseudoduganella dura]MUI14546.1 hypothetical protein [Pseudoduganella dura]GGY17014.1 hypothetical protein GCM10007386_53450 [Pseudoduganella dura]